MTLDLGLKGAVRLALGKVGALLVWKVGLLPGIFTCVCSGAPTAFLETLSRPAALTGTISLPLWKTGTLEGG